MHISEEEEDLPEITATELGMFYQIRDAMDAGESLEEIREAFDVAMGMMELSEQSKLH